MCYRTDSQTFQRSKKTQLFANLNEDGASSSKLSFRFRGHDQSADQHGVARLLHLSVDGNFHLNKIRPNLYQFLLTREYTC